MENINKLKDSIDKTKLEINYIIGLNEKVL